MSTLSENLKASQPWLTESNQCAVHRNSFRCLNKLSYLAVLFLINPLWSYHYKLGEKLKLYQNLNLTCSLIPAHGRLGLEYASKSFFQSQWNAEALRQCVRRKLKIICMVIQSSSCREKRWSCMLMTCYELIGAALMQIELKLSE